MKRRLEPRGTRPQQSARAIDSPYLTVKEVIVYLRLGSRSALQRLIIDHRLPYLRRGFNLMFDRREIDEWLRRTRSEQLQLVKRG